MVQQGKAAQEPKRLSAVGGEGGYERSGFFCG